MTEVVGAGVAKKDIVHLAAFTTDDPTAQTAAIADYVRKTYPAPKLVGDIVAKSRSPG
ncbi:MAG: hypothetical protein U0263_36245 [Polyangiaceae bacterium]